jgi:TfoX/Sxy family transcriptional regulator of competence genes
MAYDPGMAEQMRADLGNPPGLTEKNMFGGLCFLLNGNMICGVHKGGAMFRPGKSQQTQALAIQGLVPLSFTGRPMGGMVEMDADAFADDAARSALTKRALANAASLRAKG